jgi:diguanylate cyclase (GGDEF)-like protein
MRLLSVLKKIVSPSGASPRGILIASFTSIFMIFGFDLVYGSTLWLHQLYIFPLSALAFYCKPLRWVAAGIVVSGITQLMTLLSYKLFKDAVVANLLITLTANLTIAGVARAARARFAEIEALATIDPLTGLFNRRGFDPLAQREIDRQKRYGGTFSLAVLDLDRFKELNDFQGHDAGDRALCLLGTLLMEHTRRSDVIARLGGDEFVIMMPNTVQADCSTLCRGLSATISEQMAAAGFTITASIGCATFEESPESLTVALRKADKAMFAAKAMRSRSEVMRGQLLFTAEQEQR